MHVHRADGGVHQVEYVYYKRKEEAERGYFDSRPAPGVYSGKAQTGGKGYGPIAHQYH